MKINRWPSLSAALVSAVLLTGCGSSGIDILGGGSNDRANDRYEDGYGRTTEDVRGTVERVDTLDRRIYVNAENRRSTYLRNDGRDSGREVVLYYDNDTVVEFEGQTYRVDDLERGDRIAADVEETGGRLVVQNIDVLEDATTGDRYSDRGTSDRGTYQGSDRDRYRDDDNRYNNDYRNEDTLRGTVRYVDTRARLLEVEPSSGYSAGQTGRSNVVVVYYDTNTTVDFQGGRYQPENLDQGDVVEIDLSRVGTNGRLMAEQIEVISDSRSGR
ncbi:MAG TPA: hypothetical protein VHN15_01230 [Thermoanaerobaculia bacterium]|nr:hypothetical protein [Thermoanaerobaculia bacterium]